MATIMMTRKEAEAKLAELKVPRDIGGKYYILDILEALGLIKIDYERMVVDIVEEKPVIIKRKGKIVYED